MTSSISLPAAVVSAEVIKLIPWLDHRADAFGHDPRSSYVEQFWLGTLGPSTTWFLRHCVSLLDDVESTSVDLREIAITMGIGHEGGTRSAMCKTVARACRFRATRSVGPETLAVRMRLPQLSYRQLLRMPEAVQRRHEEFTAANLSHDAVGRQRSRARRLAACLVECGDSFDQAEVQLARMSFHPAIVGDAVRWAWCIHHGRSSPEAA